MARGGAAASGDAETREASVLTLGLVGVEARLVRVTVRVALDLPGFTVTAPSEGSERETRVRVRAAVAAIGVSFPRGGIAVSFDHPEFVSGGSADLAIAVGILAALGKIRGDRLAVTAIVGELALTGAVRPVRGLAAMVAGAHELGVERVVVPAASAAEAAYVRRLPVDTVDHLEALAQYLAEAARLPAVGGPPTPRSLALAPDLSDIRGMPGAVRALEVAAAGGHGLLLIGPPGAGKTMIARRLPGIMPALTKDESRTLTSIYSLAGLLSEDRPYITTRPFRAPHYTVSASGLLGGGKPVRPGEVTLAHLGTLFLDEVHEFRPGVIESLPRIVRDGEARFARGITLAARPLLVAATGACLCGYRASGIGDCTCSPGALAAHGRNLNHPLLQCLDVRVRLAGVRVAALGGAAPAETSDVVRARVATARARAADRAERLGCACENAFLSPADLDAVVGMDAPSAQLLGEFCGSVVFGEWERSRVLRVARTVADLAGSDLVGADHITEALGLAIHTDPPAGAALGPGDDEVA